MESERAEFAHESLQDRESIVKYLAAIGEGVKAGQLRLSSNGDCLCLEAPSMLRLEVEATQKRCCCSLTLTISWRRPEPTGRQSCDSLRIAGDS